MLYSFDNYTLNPEERTLKRYENVITLTPKVFETLLVLVQNHDHVMSKEELLSSIWPERFVEEANLTQNVSVLRKALGESATGKKYIATFSGRGYKFVEPVMVAEQPALTETSTPGEAAAPAASHRRLTASRRRLSYIAICAVLILIAAILLSGKLLRNRTMARLPAANAPAMVSAGVIRTMVRMAGAQFQPTWSRDGKQLAFASTGADGSPSAIYIQTLGQMDPNRITFGPGEYSSPVFSPDGNSLAYLSFRPNQAEILVYDLATRKTRKLASLLPHRYGLSCRQLDWSPNGDFLVVDDKEAAGDPSSLYLVYARNGSKFRLTYPDMDILGDTTARFSPDGTQIAFIRMKYQFEYDLFVVPVTGGEVRKLTAHSAILGDVDWESNSRLLYSAEQNGEFRLWQLDLRAANPRPVLASTLATDMPLQFSFSRSRGEIAFSGYQPDLDIWSLDLRSAAPRASDWKPVVRTPGQDIAPFFAPDGKEIAFRSDVSGKFQIWVSRADGTNAIPVPTGSLIPSVITWAPDSRSIVFSSLSAPGLYRVGLSRGFPVRQISDLPMSHPCYSADGKWIFAVMGSFLYRIPATGGTAEMLSDQGGRPIEESKDGRYLYFGHQRMDTTISRLDLATRRQEVVVRTLIPGYRDAWALTARGIIFLTERAGKPVIAIHDLNTGQEHAIADFPGPLPLIATSGFSVSPDDRTLLVVRADPASANIQSSIFRPAQETTAGPAGDSGRR